MKPLSWWPPYLIFLIPALLRVGTVGGEVHLLQAGAGLLLRVENSEHETKRATELHTLRPVSKLCRQGWKLRKKGIR